MTEWPNDPRIKLRSVFEAQKEMFEKTLDFYLELLQRHSHDELWKYKKETIFYDELAGLISPDYRYPSLILETAIQTMDEYLAAIDSFSDDQLAAFLLGVGLTWLPIRYWGIQELYDYREKIAETLSFYERLEAEKPQKEIWKYKRLWGLNPLPTLMPQDSVLPTEILKEAQQLIEIALQVLADRPF